MVTYVLIPLFEYVKVKFKLFSTVILLSRYFALQSIFFFAHGTDDKVY